MPRGSAPGERRGGRQKGTPNKKTQAIQDKLDSIGLDVFESMAQIAVQAKAEGDMQTALTALKELAQYIAPKRKAVEVAAEVSGPEGGPIEVSRIELVAPNIDSTN